jgi:hypothetical protein
MRILYNTINKYNQSSYTYTARTDESLTLPTSDDTRLIYLPYCK